MLLERNAPQEIEVGQHLARAEHHRGERVFRKLHREGMTLLVVTHEKRMSRAASRVLVLERGALAADPALEGSA